MLSAVLLVVMFCALTSSGGEINVSDWETGSHEYIVAKYFQKRQYMRTSNIGAILLKNEFVNISPRRKRFLVYIHTSNVSRLDQRDKRPEDRKNPLEGCSVLNCEFVEEDRWLPEAEAVLVPLGEGDPPGADARAARTQRQRWVFLSLTSPMYTIDKDQIEQLGNLFDWSMTYRTESDVPVPFGRTLPLAAPATANRSLTEVAALVPNWERKQHEVLAAALLSNCRPKTRMNYLNTLKMHMRVHYYGSCFYRKPSKQCPKIGDCHSIKRYIFYLAFENSECNEYMSQRVWSHALRNGAIPVVQGAAREQCAALLPPGSFLHVADYATPRDLARHMRDIATSHEKILRHHVWRRHFEAREEATTWAGAAGSRLCRLCEALNYNARRRRLYSQDDLRRFLDPTINCRNIP